MHHIGIDWADQKHEICVQAADGRVLSEFKISHDWRGFERLRTTLKALEPLEINSTMPLSEYLTGSDALSEQIPTKTSAEFPWKIALSLW